MKQSHSVCRVFLCLLSAFVLLSISSILPNSVEPAGANTGSPTSPVGVAAAAASSVGVFPISIVGGKVAMGEVFLSEPAPAGGALVNLSSNSPLASVVPKTVRVYERESSAIFTIKTKQVTSQTTVTISATYSGTVSASLTLLPKTTALSSVSVSPTSVVGGTTAQGTANLTGPAPTGGLIVSLACNNPLVGGVPPSVTVSAGSTSATFTVSTNQVSASTSVNISGSCAGVTSGAQLGVTPNSSLVVAYAFNEASGTAVADASGNGNTATLINGAAWIAGKYGNAVSFDGVNDYLSIPNSTSTNISGTALTLSMWIKPETLSGGDSVVIGKFWNPTWTEPFYQYGLELDGGYRPHFYVATTGGLLGVQMGSTLTMSQWSNLAVVFNGTQVQFYLNGALVSTQSLSASITARSNPMNLGADAQPNQYCKGQMDDLRIYNRALSASEVQSDMNTPIGGGAPPPPDTTPPVISVVSSSSITSGGATIGWTTDEAGNSQVDYGTTTAYGSSTTLDSTLVAGHSAALSGLSGGTLYHYCVKSRDAAGNLATSGDFTFTTLTVTDTTPPVISGVTASSITSGGANISWSTNEASNTQVDYGTTTAYGSSTTLVSTLVTSHSTTLSGLTASTLYHYRVKSRDAAGNLATSGDFTFTTLPTDVTPPVISGVGASAITSGGATIGWTTNEASNTQVDYGTSTTYGSSTTLVATLVTSHSTTVSGLSANTLYHYRVKSRDAAGNLATSGDSTFTTASTDTTPPVISGVSASSITSGGGTINWTTNEASNTQVDYGTTTSYGSSTSLVSTLVTSHSAALSGLSASTLYHYRVKSRDAAGNLAASSDFTFSTASGSSCPGFVIEGFGRNTTGGCGGTLYFVTSLANSGAGTLRDFLENRTGPRIIRFAVSGDIRLTSDLEAIGGTGNTHGNVTIDGSDAPNGGICIRGQYTLFVTADNVIVRYIRFRQDPPHIQQGCMNILGGNNVVVDHCSFTWGQDGNLDVANGASNVTIQWCILAENSASGSSLIRYLNVTGVTWHHNLFANNTSTRNGGTYCGDMDVVNNVIYRNFSSAPSRFENLSMVAPDGAAEATGTNIATRVNYVGNLYRAGSNENTNLNAREIYLRGDYSGSSIASVYFSGNISPQRPNNTLPEAALALQTVTNLVPITGTRHNFPAVTTTPAAQALTDVLAGVGATLPCRDAVDRRITDYVSNSTGGIPYPGAGANPNVVGGWPDLTQPCGSSARLAVPKSIETAFLFTRVSALASTKIDGTKGLMTTSEAKVSDLNQRISGKEWPYSRLGGLIRRLKSQERDDWDSAEELYLPAKQPHPRMKVRDPL